MSQLQDDIRKARRALCYVSGPMSGPTALEREKNRLYGELASRELWERDILHFCPMVSCPPIGASDLEYEDWMVHDVEMLRRSDFVFMLPGWENSRGSVRENRLAAALCKPIVYFDHDAAADMARNIEKRLNPEVPFVLGNYEKEKA